MNKFPRRLFLINLTLFISIFIINNNVYPSYAKNSIDDASILILNSYENGLKWTDDETKGITSTIKESLPKADISIEYMDWKRYPYEQNLINMYSYLKYKYLGIHIDLIICTDDAALKFALQHRSEMFSDAPIVFCGVNREGANKLITGYRNVTGVIEEIDPGNTIKTALDIFPNTEDVYVIFDNTESGKSTGSLSIAAIKKVKSTLNIIPLNKKSSYEIVNDAKKLSQNSIILFTSYFANINGVPIDTNEFLNDLSKNSHIPIFHLYDFGLGSGSIGGRTISGYLQGKKAAELSLRILQGESASSIPISEDNTTYLAFDYNQLKRFQVPLSALPRDSKIINMPFSFFQSYKSLVFTVVGVFAILVAFITVLLFYIKRIRKMKIQLQDGHEQLTQIYEELAATDEELKAQLDELTCTQNNLSESEERYRLVIEAANDGIWDWNLKTNMLYFSSNWYKMLGYDEYRIENTAEFFYMIIHPKDIEKFNKVRDYHFKNKTNNYECEIRLKASDGNYKWIHTRGKAIFDEAGTPYRVIGSHMDISKIKDYQNELHYLAYHDTLTGLFNRTYLLEKVGTRIKNLYDKNVVEAMLFLDTDNFKFVNDTIGHSFGDKLIIEISKRLLSFTDENSMLFRLGGDEFIFYIKNIKNRKDIDSYVEKILSAFKIPFDVDGNVISTSLSIGISIFPDDGTTIDKLLRCSDMAMYKVKQRGKNGFFYYNHLLNDEILTRVNIEKHLRKAIENNEFTVYYQPQVNVSTKKIVGFEALIRWASPELGMVPTLRFIKISEETGFIITLGEWILFSACKYIKSLNDIRGTSYKISVNISVIQLIQENFTDIVTSVLDETGLDPSLLELEITESIIMDSPDVIIKKLKTLREMGLSIALDDFGTGYSSLAYLKHIPITKLKIDKLFIDDICNSAHSNTVTDSIIDLGHKMGLVIVAEGVEIEEQLKYLERSNCDIIQGYLFSKPLHPSDLEKIL